MRPPGLPDSKTSRISSPRAATSFRGAPTGRALPRVPRSVAFHAGGKQRGWSTRISRGGSRRSTRRGSRATLSDGRCASGYSGKRVDSCLFTRGRVECVDRPRATRVPNETDPLHSFHSPGSPRVGS